MLFPKRLDHREPTKRPTCTKSVRMANKRARSEFQTARDAAAEIFLGEAPGLRNQRARPTIEEILEAADLAAMSDAVPVGSSSPPPLPPRTFEAGYRPAVPMRRLPIVPPVQAPVVRHPMAARLKYKLLKRGSALLTKLNKLEGMQNSGRFIKDDGTPRLQAVKVGKRRSVVKSLYDAKRESILREMEEMRQDVAAFGFGRFLLQKVPDPPENYSHSLRNLEMQTRGTAVLRL
jgi:hypothetical protein